MTSQISSLMDTVTRALAIDDGLVLGDRRIVRQFWRWLNNYRTASAPPVGRTAFLTPHNGVPDGYQWWDMGTVVFGDHRGSGVVWRIPRTAFASMPHIPFGTVIPHISHDTQRLPAPADGVPDLPLQQGRHLRIVGPNEG